MLEFVDLVLACLTVVHFFEQLQHTLNTSLKPILTLINVKKQKRSDVFPLIMQNVRRCNDGTGR